MRDLLIITPSRGRPEYVKRLVAAVAATTTAQTDIVFGFDTDDPALMDNLRAAAHHTMHGHRVQVVQGPRLQLGPWTNYLAKTRGDSYYAVASLGDDHKPETLGWDADCIGALKAMGGGFACPNGLRRPEYPEAVVASVSVVRALGWFCEPTLQHWCVDQVWLELAQGADCWAYLPYTVVAHTPHPDDATEAGNQSHLNRDFEQWHIWQEQRRAADIETVRGALARPVIPS